MTQIKIISSTVSQQDLQTLVNAFLNPLEAVTNIQYSQQGANAFTCVITYIV